MTKRHEAYTKVHYLFILLHRLGLNVIVERKFNMKKLYEYADSMKKLYEYADRIEKR